jgi:hypothetical protein
MIYSLILFSSHTYYYNNKQNNEGGTGRIRSRKKKAKELARRIIQIKHF